MTRPTPPDHGPLTDDLDAMTYTNLDRVLRLATLAADLPSLRLAVATEIEHRHRMRQGAADACSHHRCIECATDAELLALLPPFPGGAA